MDMLFDSTFSYGAKVAVILDNNAIDITEDLEQALDPWPKKIPVFDSKNKSRLLGHVHEIRRTNLRHGNSIRLNLTLPFCRPVTPWEQDLNIVSMKVVEFSIDKETKDGWVYTPVFLTSSPLDDLMKLRQFTLPGETRKQADERLYRSNLL